jgi:thioredoxin 1
VRKTYAIVAFGLAGFIGVTACSTASPSPPPSSPQVTSQSAAQAASPSAPQSSPQTVTQSSPQTVTQSSPPPGAGKVTIVTDETFEGKVLESGKPVVVVYTAEWCGPCRRNAVVFDEIAAEHADKITVVKLNIDENPAVPAVYGVEQIPTTDVFSNGQMVKRITGAKPKDDMLHELAEFI